MTDPATASAWPPRRTQPAAALRPAPETGNGTHLGELHLVDPLEVFAGLAAACVPAFCDGLRFDLATEGGQQLNVSFPLAADDATGTTHIAKTAHRRMATAARSRSPSPANRPRTKHRSRGR